MEDTKTTPPYTALAAVYDYMMAHVNYPRWARYLLRLIQRTGISVHRILDVGCGTGQLTAAFHRLGYHSDGCDPSKAMLQVARQHFPQLHFYTDQLPHLRQTPDNLYNVVVSLFDTINYLPNLQALEHTLQTVYHKLAAPGVFIFDAVSPTLCENHFHQVVEKEVLNDRYAYERYSYFNRTQLQQINEITIFTPDGIFVETHVQRIFPFHQILQLIRNSSPFQLFSAYEEFTFQPINDSSLRGHFVLVKGLADGRTV